MIEHALRTARLQFHLRAEARIGSDEFLSYVRANRLDTLTIGWHAGAVAVLPIARHPGNRFELDDAGDPGFVCHAFAADGETVTDLVAWRLEEPECPLAMFGRCGLLGLWQAMAPGTYFMGGSLKLHRTPLAWLQTGCDGAAIVDHYLAGRQLLEVPGRVAAGDRAHAREVARLLRTTADIDNKVIYPTAMRRAA